MKTILCVEDEHRILDNNRQILEDNGYAVLTALNLSQARKHLETRSPDAVVLDIMLPDGNGLDLLRELRESGNDVPVIMLTAWGKSADVVRGLNAGANDYVSKPFEYEVLLARINAMFRNVEQVPETLTKGALTLKIEPMVATLGGRDMLLTQKEFLILLLFVRNEGRFINAEYMYEKIWEQSMNKDDSAIKNTVSRLRKKLAGSNYNITTERGEGYCFERNGR